MRLSGILGAIAVPLAFLWPPTALQWPSLALFGGSWLVFVVALGVVRRGEFPPDDVPWNIDI
jgi:hypothetical protein